MTRGSISSTLRAGIVVFLAAAALRAANPPQGFQETVVFSGLSNPTQVRFLPDGRVLVAEKSGLIKMFASLTATTPTIVADLRTNVHNFWDRGLLGLAVDPNFATNGYIYVAYAYDAPIGGTAPTWGVAGNSSDGCPTPPGATTDGCVISNRVSRLQIVNGVAGPEQVLINDWCQQYPSHSAGTLAFGADGMLYVTGGEGASFNFADYGQGGGTSGSPPPVPKNPCGDPPAGVGGTETPPTAEGGALRSQSLRRPTGEPVLLSGTLLRVDPATGAAPPDNPLAGDSDPNAQRIVGFGLRNPFRFTIKPGTNQVYIGDVGWNQWEEINSVPNPLDPNVRNFGWPCYEGTGPQTGYQSANLNLCNSLYSAGTATPPLFTYNHQASAVPGDGCTVGSSSIGGMSFYNGPDYPPAYQNALFFSDYSRKCIWVMFPDADGNPDPANVMAWKSSAAGPVDIQSGPNGDIFYVDFDGGTVRQYSYLGPTAVATASPDSGAPPLTVQFDGTGSQPGSPGDTITFAWDLDGDGNFNDSTDPAPQYVYGTAGSYTARLKVTDNHGISTLSDPLTINVDTHAPTANIQQPNSNFTWAVGDTISFQGKANDPQQGQLPPSALTWTVLIHHCPSNCHTHVYQTFPGVDSGSFPAPDHEYPSYLELRLTATDSSGLQSTASVNLDPQTVPLTFQSSPSGLQLSVGATTAATPFTETVIIGSQNSISAPTPQGSYAFSSWSDSGAQTHNIVAPSTAATYTATYVSSSNLPPPWTDTDVGNVVLSGSALWVNGTFTDRGAGADIWGTADAFHYIDQPISSDAAMIVRVASVPNTNAWAKAGIMIRESLAPNATNAFIALTPGHGVVFQRRKTTGGTSTTTAGPGVVAPYWLKLERSGTTFNAYASPNGTSWTLVGTDTISMATNAYVGLAVTSHNTSQRCAATFNSVSLTTGPPNSPPSVSITSPTEGATFTAPASVTINASALDTDGSVAQVEFYEGGFFLGSDTTAPYSFTWTNAQAGGYALTARATDNLGAVTTSAPVNITINPGANPPPTVSITGPTDGATFTAPATIAISADASDDGSVTKVDFYNGATLLGTDATSPYAFSWNSVAAGSYTLTAKATDNLGAVTTSAPVNVTVNPASNTPPTVSLTSPTDGQTFTAPATVSLAAAASDPGGSVARVDFYNGPTLLATDTTSPYSFSWTNVAAGSFTLTAVATDNLGAQTTSAPATITVNPAGNPPPTVSITAPVNGSSFTAPANITINATASDDGSVDHVDFYSGATLLGTSTTAPYTFTWSGVAVGAYTLTARATDNLGAVTTSAPVNVTVNAGMPAPWADQDVGATGVVGSASYSNGTFSVKASGADIQGTVDAFHFVYQQVTGDATIVARVATLPAVHAWSKAGVMVRDGLAAGAANAFMTMTASNGAWFQRRLAAGGSTTVTSGGAAAVPYWVKLVRQGDTFSGYKSLDGVNWSFVGADTVPMGTTVDIGLAVTSHVNTKLVTSTLNNVTVTQP
jgi:glucose/arabinose dehydrogenase